MCVSVLGQKFLDSGDFGWFVVLQIVSLWNLIFEGAFCFSGCLLFVG